MKTLPNQHFSFLYTLTMYKKQGFYVYYRKIHENFKFMTFFFRFFVLNLKLKTN